MYVAHEQTTVPFFGTADFQDSSVTKLSLSTASAGVLGADVALSPDLGYLRFCSAAMAGPTEGFDDYVFFTGEETDDIVDVAPGAEFGPDPALSPQRRAATRSRSTPPPATRHPSRAWVGSTMRTRCGCRATRDWLG